MRSTTLHSTTLDACPDQGWLPAAPARARFQHLAARTGLHWRVLALAIGIPVPLARRLAGECSRDRIRWTDAAAICQTGPAQLDALASTLMRARHARRVLVRVLDHGLALDDVAQRAQCTQIELDDLIARARVHCSRLLYLKLQALLDELEHVPGAAPLRVVAMEPHPMPMHHSPAPDAA